MGDGFFPYPGIGEGQITTLPDSSRCGRLPRVVDLHHGSGLYHVHPRVMDLDRPVHRGDELPRVVSLDGAGRGCHEHPRIMDFRHSPDGGNELPRIVDFSGSVDGERPPENGSHDDDQSSYRPPKTTTRASDTDAPNFGFEFRWHLDPVGHGDSVGGMPGTHANLLCRRSHLRTLYRRMSFLLWQEAKDPSFAWFPGGFAGLIVTRVGGSVGSDYYTGMTTTWRAQRRRKVVGQERVWWRRCPPSLMPDGSFSGAGWIRRGRESTPDCGPPPTDGRRGR